MNNPPAIFFSKRVFAGLFIIWLTIPVVDAIITSALFNTQWMIALAVGAWLFGNRQQVFERSEKATNSGVILGLLLSVILSLSLSYGLFILPNSHGILYVDTSYYADLANLVNVLGLESIRFSALEPNEITSFFTPYHYTDIWFLSAFSKILNSSPHHAYFWAYVPFSFSVFFYGLLCLYTQLEKNARWNIILCSAAVASLIFPALPFKDGGWTHSALLSPKILPYQIFALAAFVFARNARDFFALFALLAFVNPLILPAILVAMLLLHIKRYRGIKLWSGLKDHAIFILLGLAYAVYAWVFGFGQSAIPFTFSLKMFLLELFRHHLPRIILYAGIIVLPILILLWRRKTHAVSEKIEALFVLILSALIAASILQSIPETFQMIHLVLLALYPILSLVLLVFLQQNKWGLSVGLSLGVVFVLLQQYDVYAKSVQAHNLTQKEKAEIKRIMDDLPTQAVMYRVAKSESAKPYMNFHPSRYLHAMHPRLLSLTLNAPCEEHLFAEPELPERFLDYPGISFCLDGLNDEHRFLEMQAMQKADILVSEIGELEWAQRYFDGFVNIPSLNSVLYYQRVARD